MIVIALGILAVVCALVYVGRPQRTYLVLALVLGALAVIAMAWGDRAA